MKDCLGKDLSVDDSIVYTVSGYEELAKGYVHSFTPKKVRICKAIGREPCAVKFPNQIVKVGKDA